MLAGRATQARLPTRRLPAQVDTIWSNQQSVASYQLKERTDRLLITAY
jgi:hypothetical protein